MKRLMVATVLLLATTNGFVWAQAPATSDPHHPPGAATPPAPAQPPPGQHGMMGGMPMMMNMMGGMPMMMNMMGGMPMMMNMMGDMPMMGMMRTMGMMGRGGMATIDRVEGRIAFLHTELKITDAQASAWNAFADALRANAKKLGEVRASMMPQPGAAQPQSPSLVARLDLQERWLLARLEGTRTIKTAFSNLYSTMLDEQKKTADEILAPHMGIGMGMTMTPRAMQGQMGPAQGLP